MRVFEVYLTVFRRYTLTRSAQKTNIFVFRSFATDNDEYIRLQRTDHNFAFSHCYIFFYSSLMNKLKFIKLQFWSLSGDDSVWATPIFLWYKKKYWSMHNASCPRHFRHWFWVFSVFFCWTVFACSCSRLLFLGDGYST